MSYTNFWTSFRGNEKTCVIDDGRGFRCRKLRADTDTRFALELQTRNIAEAHAAACRVVKDRVAALRSGLAEHTGAELDAAALTGMLDDIEAAILQAEAANRKLGFGCVMPGLLYSPPRKSELH